MKSTILRATRSDYIATGVITTLSLLAVFGVWITSDIREVEYSPAQKAYDNSQVINVLYEHPQEKFHLPIVELAGVHRPLTSGNLLIAPEENGVRAVDHTGQDVWSYKRSDAKLCSLGTAWNKVIATFETGVGCGDVVALHAASGRYADTRSANNSAEVASVGSNDRVGTVSSERVELWRSDLVRTVEYGEVEAKQEGDFQANEECTINSALTRTELLAVLETCPGDTDKSWLRLQKVTPEDSRKPEVEKDIPIDSAGARLIAVSQDAAAVFIPDDSPRIESYNKQGQKVSSTRVTASQSIAQASTPYAPATADLPHHMTWFDGERLYLLNPASLEVEHIIEEAIGTGIAMGNKLVVPTKKGISEFDWNNGKILRTVSIDRGHYSGSVHLQRVGLILAEKRGNEIVALGK